MALAPGVRLGAYEVTARIGAGGMGEVWRAHDTELGRDVALKILPEAFAADPERLARFQREAQVLASLNHPNIAQIYGLEKSGDTRALVIELVEGPTLADRIAHGPIPVDETLPIATQIAEALEAAHEQGVVHRDLKPANIKLRPDGTVKVLDFGLAKLAQASDSGLRASALSQSPTITTPAMTQAGIILGTAAYMSPEQARGKTVDRRADVWAFGAVLYEMLTGWRAFGGEDLSTTLARVVEREPDWNLLPSAMSPAVVSFLRRCLAKDPRRRVQAIGDVRLAIEGAFDLPSSGTGRSVVSWRRTTLPWLVAASAIVLAVAAGLSRFVGENQTAGAERPLRRLTIDLGDMTLPRGQGPALDISRDGELIVFTAERNGVRQLYRRALGAFEAVPIQGTEGARMPFLSPDGRWVAFTDERLRAVTRTPVAGGDAFTVCSLCEIGVWGDDGSIVYSSNGRISRVSERGGDSEVLVGAMPEHGIDSVNNPVPLQGGRAVMFEIGGLRFGGVGIVSLETRQVLVVTDNGSNPFYSPTGHVVFGRDDALFAVPIDLERFQLTGPVTPVLPGVRIENGGAVQAALSRNGVLVYAPADEQVGTQLVWVSGDGQVESVLEEGRVFNAPRISPDGRMVAMQINAGGGSDIWIHEAGTLRPLTSSGVASNPIWSPDGRSITFSARSGASYTIQSISLDGQQEPRTIVSSESPITPEDWFPDGTQLVVREGVAARSLFVVDALNPSSRRPVLGSAYSVDSAAVSPSGSWIAYISEQTGTREVYVRPLRDPGGERRVSVSGGEAPSWGRTDGELLYFTGETLVRASLGSGPFDVAARTILFSSGEYWNGFFRAHYDVHADGRRLLMLRQTTPASQARSELRVVENWFSVLRELAPANSGGR